MEQPMTPNQIESAKESINFLTRTMLAYIAGVYLLVGAVGNYLMEWFERDEYVWSEFAVMPAVAIVVAIVLSLEAARLQLKIKAVIKRIGETP